MEKLAAYSGPGRVHPPCVLLQTIQQYQVALALGQTAFETPNKQAQPLPHIFGSAAYIQDPHAGLGSLHPEQDISVNPTTSNDFGSSATRNRGTATGGQASRQTDQATSASALPEQADTAYQPQNFKAMLEAALKGNFAAPSGLEAESEAADFSQYQRSTQQGSVADGTCTDTNSMSLHDSKQHSEDEAASTDLPHVLAWLEKGRSLFDEDEE